MVWRRTGGVLIMKKSILSIITLIFMVIVSSVAFAQSDLDNDPKYISCPVGMGFIRYIDTASVDVQEYRPPQYIITISEVTRHMNDIQNTRLRYCTLKFKYDYTNRKMYLYCPNHGDGFKDRYIFAKKSSKKPIDTSINWDSEWQYIDPGVYYGEGTGHLAVAGEIAFAIAYNLKFHGEKYKIFQDGFYDRLPNASKIRDRL